MMRTDYLKGSDSLKRSQLCLNLLAKGQGFAATVLPFGQLDCSSQPTALNSIYGAVVEAETQSGGWLRSQNLEQGEGVSLLHGVVI